jgi:hypothetical protein
MANVDIRWQYRIRYAGETDSKEIIKFSEIDQTREYTFFLLLDSIDMPVFKIDIKAGKRLICFSRKYGKLSNGVDTFLKRIFYFGYQETIAGRNHKAIQIIDPFDGLVDLVTEVKDEIL